MLHALRRLFAPSSPDRFTRAFDDSIGPEERLKNTEQNLQAITCMMGQSTRQLDDITTMLDMDGKLTGGELMADRLHRYNPKSDADKCVELDETLESYQQLDTELRMQLARKITRLLPDLAHSKKKLVLDHAVRVLKTIAEDQDERVRMMLAHELSDLPDAPIDVIRTLAYDPDYRVACPILEFSPLLGDHELLDIIASCPVPGVVEAISRRTGLSESVSIAVVKTGQSTAIHHLLQNNAVTLSGEAMDQIITLAPEHEIWHESLVQRPELTHKTINRIAGFMSQHLLAELESNGHLAIRPKRHAKRAVMHRLNSWSEDQIRKAELLASELHHAGRLDEECISTAIHAANEPFVIAALTYKAQMTRDKVRKILRSESARAITALAWESGLSMRCATDLQMKIGRVHHASMIYARGGTDYPLSANEMQTYLEIFS